VISLNCIPWSRGFRIRSQSLSTIRCLH
jgi:hypothetical protein